MHNQHMYTLQLYKHTHTHMHTSCHADITFCVQEGRSVEVPVYNFATHQRSQQTRHVEPADVIIVEGGVRLMWMGERVLARVCMTR
jgi:uridine kinase